MIQSTKYKQYEDNGYIIDENLSLLGADVYNNCYTNTKWDFEMYDSITDTASNTWCRSPGISNVLLSIRRLPLDDPTTL